MVSWREGSTSERVCYLAVEETNVVSTRRTTTPCQYNARQQQHITHTWCAHLDLCRRPLPSWCLPACRPTATVHQPADRAPTTTTHTVSRVYTQSLLWVHSLQRKTLDPVLDWTSGTCECWRCLYHPLSRWHSPRKLFYLPLLMIRTLYVFLSQPPLQCHFIGKKN